MADNKQAQITLHWLDGSRAQRILWLLIALDVPYELKIYHRIKGVYAPPTLQKIFPLGKSPLVTVLPAGAPADAEPLVLAESGFIVDYLCSHFGQESNLVPKRWRDGCQGQLGGETAAYLRFQYLMYYAEGSLMPYLVFYLVLSTLKGPTVPWFVRPLTSSIANQINSAFLLPNIRSNLQLMETFLVHPPEPADGQGYICGDHLTAADILLSFPLLAARSRCQDMGPWNGGSAEAEFPVTFAYLDRLEREPGYQKSIAKIEEVDGKFSVLTTARGR
ncbi:glutathione s-transferase [Grosmannia clavigera kw1407]|uniref:Glutathione s-transferase n=1 Tax=Grosmannia clavigera (strain kw1407 / UAMH 11150) TaxID=655863 RepID=F0XF90_GROCL|nr:glutathione s-transferase [Grosmannia clavigera kw1407]EFX04073.1 glutathione s-transferase [Grosmannia clavigera kw1407]